MARLFDSVAPEVGDLRSKTSGQASYSMEFHSYGEVPKSVADEIIEKGRGGE